MSEWQTIKFEELLDYIGNGTSDLQVSEITAYPVTRIETISDGVVNYKKVGYVRHCSEKYKLRNGDILLSNINSIKHIGKVAFYNSNAELFHGMNLLLLRFKSNVEPLYIYYTLVFHKRWFERMACQAINQASINQTTIENLHLNIASIKTEQRKIVRILSTCDAVIEKTQAAIEKYKAIKQGMLHDLFTRGIDVTTGKLRPQYENAPELYKESKLGMVPMEWEVETFEETTLKIADRDHFTPIYVDAGVAIISPKDFDENEEISFSECKYITYEAHLKNAEKTDLKTGDLIFTRIGALLGKVCMVEGWMPEFSILHSACMIRVNPKIMDEMFYLQFIKSYFFQNQIKMEIQSIGVPDLGLDKIKAFLMLRPSPKEQKAIGEKLAVIDCSIKNEKNIFIKLQQIKSGLMNDLLSGKKRVKLPEEALAV
ncbi:MAG: restriction endonuclease subunit S [Syntrophaceae bacterium]|nr:restriction endonuclease subunit S [Syntrophaceae bacterium]